ncbi:MAG: hypothetical protein ACI8RU_001340 [Zhongshania aliphaticivorans]|jgi:hypothetical protein
MFDWRLIFAAAKIVIVFIAPDIRRYEKEGYTSNSGAWLDFRGEMSR